MSPRRIAEEPLERTSVTLPRSLARRVRRESEVTGRSASAVVRDALQKYFGGRPPEALPPFVAVGGSGRADTSERAEDLVAREIERRHPRRRPRR